MSVLVHHLSGSGFPFSISRFKGIPQAGDAQPVGPVEPWRLAGAVVTAGYIDEGPSDAVGKTPPVAKPQPTRRAGRQIGLQSSLKLLPLQGFIWGSRAAAPLPRTRAEHVLILSLIHI